MRRNQKNSNRGRGTTYASTLVETIIVTNHVIDRYFLRTKKEVVQKYVLGDKERITRDEAIKNIINEVRGSRLIRIEGEFEHRLFRGDVYVVKREGGITQDVLTVITLKLTNSAKKERFSSGFSMDTVQHNEMGIKGIA